MMRKMIYIFMALLCSIQLCSAAVPVYAEDNKEAESKAAEDEDAIKEMFRSIGSKDTVSGAVNADIQPKIEIAEDLIEDPKAQEQTLMIYMVGSNLESKNGMATKDIMEMMDSDIDLSKTNVIIYTGGAAKWDMGIECDKNYILRLNSQKGLDVIGKSYELDNMGAAQTLAEFLNFGYDNYPASHYSLIMWDHGAGPLIGFGMDEMYDGDHLYLFEIEEALQASPFTGDNKLDWIGFDACLMSCYEVAALFSNHAEYMIASQETEPGCGWNYAFLSALNKTSDPKKIGKSIIDGYASFYETQSEGKTEPDLTLACMELGKVEALTEALDAFFEEMRQSLEKDGFAQNVQTRDDVKQFGVATSAAKGSGYDLLDLGDLAEHFESLCPKSAHKLQKALDHLVVYQKSNVEEAHGLSVYYPHDNQSYYEQFGQYLLSLINPSEAYIEYMDHFVGAWMGDSAEAEMIWREMDRSIEQEDGKLKMSLTSAQMMNLQDVKYTILQECKEGVYTPVVMDCKVVPDAQGVISVDLNQEVFAITDKLDDWMVIPVRQNSVKKKRANYCTVNAKVVRSYGEIIYSDMIDIILSFREDTSNGAITIKSVEEVIEDASLGGGTMAGKSSVEIDGFDTFAYTSIRQAPTYDADGQLLPYDQWESDGYNMINYNYMSDQLLIEKKSIDDDESNYICQIVVTDVNGHEYASDIAEITKTPVYEVVEEKTANGTMVYYVYDDHAVLYGYAGSDEKIEISAQVNGKPVTEIHTSVLDPTHDYEAEAPETVATVIMPDTIEVIQNGAFSGSEALKEIRFSKNLKSIGASAFKYCSALTHLDLPEGLERIENCAFYECTHVTEAHLPERIQYIGYGAFAGILDMENFTIEGENEAYVVKDQVLYSKDMTTLIQVMGKRTGSFDIPETVTEIADYAFFGSDNVEYLLMDEELQEEHLNHVSFPENLEIIGDFSFYNTLYLEEIHIPDQVTYVGCQAFSNNWHSMVSNSLNDLDEVYIGEKLNHIGANAFESFLINSFDVADGNMYYSSKDGFLLNKAGDALLMWPKVLTGDVKVPDGVVSILQDSLLTQKTEGLKSVTIPDSVRNIAFYNTLPEPEEKEGTKITFGSGLSLFEQWLIAGSYESFELSKDNKNFVQKGQCVYSSDGTKLWYANGKEGEKRFEIPEGITSISPLALVRYDQLETLILPDSIGAEAIMTNHNQTYTNMFDNRNLKEIRVSDTNKTLKSVDGILYSKDGTQMYFCPVGHGEKMEIAEGTEIIEKRSAYTLGAHVEEIVIPEGVRIIRSDNFEYMGNEYDEYEVHVYLPDSLELVSDFAFSDCVNVIVHCHKGTYAEEFAKSRGFKIKY